MTAPYDLSPYTARDHDNCRVTWMPRHGESMTVTGDFLDIKDDRAVLACGIYDAGEALGFGEPEDDYALAISTLVDRQLALRTCAELHCPEGHFRIELITPPHRE